MVDPVTTRRLAFRALFLALVALILFVRLLPLSSLPTRWPGPDMMVCLTLVWVLRRPDHVPATIIVAVFLLDDLLAMRPPGLWASLMLLGTEFLRSRKAMTRDLPFLVEWLLISAVILAMVMANRLVLALFMVPQPGFDRTILQALATMAVYPLVALAAQHAFGLRRVTAGDVEALGHRL